MYLTKFPLNMSRRESRRMLAAPYSLHAAIAGSFPCQQSESEAGRLLWRVDRGDDGLATLYIVSPDAPSLVGLDEQIGWPDLPPQWKTRDYGPLLNSIRNGQTYQFRLVANPVVSRRAIRAERGSSKRLPHLTTLQQASWLVGKEAYAEAGVDLPDFIAQADSTRAERSGFEVCRVDDDGSLQLVVSDSKVVKFPQGASRRTITLATVRYDGILRVTDADRLRHALTFGMGHGKGFGCGLLTLAQWRQ